jgi:hypothetical protein
LRRSTSALEAVGGDQDALGGQVKVGGLVHDDSVLAAQLQKDPLDPPLARGQAAGRLVDPEAHLEAPREVDEPGPGVLHQVGSHLLPLAGDQVHHPRGEARLVEDLKGLGGDDRRVLGGLGHHGVAHSHGPGDHPGEDGQGKVPRGDDHPGPQEQVEALVVLPGVGHHLHRGVLVLEGLAGVVLQEVYGLGHLGASLHPVFADLVDQGGLQLPPPPLHDGRRLQEEAAPVLLGPVLPGHIGPPGGLEGRLGLGLPRLGHRPHHLAGGGGV